MSGRDEGAFASVMARLQRKYRLGLADKADELESALAHVVDRARGEGEGEGDGDKEIVDLIHRLAGTAGSFDVYDVSQQAADLELRMSQGQNAHELAEDIAALIALMRTYASQASQEHPPDEPAS